MAGLAIDRVARVMGSINGDSMFEGNTYPRRMLRRRGTVSGSLDIVGRNGNSKP